MRRRGRQIAMTALAVPLMLAACAQPGDGGDTQAIDTDAAVPEATPSAPPPDQFSGTAWRSIAEDGARYTTYFDAGGRYRDLRNGDPWHSGAWTFNDIDGQRLCFTPDGETVEQSCWMPDTIDGDRLYASNRDGRRIELRQVEYVAPDPDETAEGDEGEESTGEGGDAPA